MSAPDVRVSGAERQRVSDAERQRVSDAERQRVSDAERQRVVTALSTAVGEGRLTLAEADERIAAAWASRYGGELTALTADLPAPAPPRAGPGRRPALFGLIALLLVITWALSPVPFFWPVLPLTFLAVRAVRTSRSRHRAASA